MQFFARESCSKTDPRATAVRHNGRDGLRRALARKARPQFLNWEEMPSALERRYLEPEVFEGGKILRQASSIGLTHRGRQCCVVHHREPLRHTTPGNRCATRSVLRGEAKWEMGPVLDTGRIHKPGLTRCDICEPHHAPPRLL